MKGRNKSIQVSDFVHGGLFALIAHLAVFILFVIIVLFPFDSFQYFSLLAILFGPSIFYCIFANRRSVFYALGMLAGDCVVVGICLLLSYPLFDPFIDLIKPLVYGEPGFLFGVQFVIEFIFRVIALTAPPIIHLICHASNCIIKKLKRKKTDMKGSTHS